LAVDGESAFKKILHCIIVKKGLLVARVIALNPQFYPNMSRAKIASSVGGLLMEKQTLGIVGK
jgi:hypothetical protein